ncbi:hypothetical protein NRS6110_04508 [Bacillus subtilis]|nr:hypothetical protein NRS6110_04508 [Bacillus subtilis]
MSAEVEEVVVDAQPVGPVESEDLGEHRAQCRLDRALRCPARAVAADGCHVGQRTSVEFPVVGQRDLGERGHRGGHHVRREGGGEMHAQIVEHIRVLGRRDDIGHEP